MSLNPATQSRIESYLDNNKVVLFMKGTPDSPQCGFSAKTVGMVNALVNDFEAINVLADQEIREGIKAFGNWPTIPQLYIDKELVGGCDIVTEMFNSGELHEMLGMPKPDRTPPEIHISEKAAEAIRGSMEQQPPGVSLFLTIDPQWQHQFSVQAADKHAIRAESNGIELYMDVATAQKARGLQLDWVESFQGAGLAIDNPNAPKPINQMSVTDLKKLMDESADFVLIDVRPASERSIAVLPNDEQYDESRISALPKDTKIVLYCRTGNRSGQAGEYLRQQGFTDVNNLVGGTNAWSELIDPSMRKY
ncbi:MAG: Grx4 family monothiol glutaredoxin [bacterium]